MVIDVPFFSVLLSLTIIHFSVSATLFYRRRHTFPIRGHAMGLVLLAMVGVLIDGAQTMVAGILDANDLFYCVTPVFTKTSAIYVYALAYVARAWRIWFKYRYSNEKVRAERKRIERVRPSSSEETVTSTVVEGATAANEKRVIGTESLGAEELVGGTETTTTSVLSTARASLTSPSHSLGLAIIGTERENSDVAISTTVLDGTLSVDIGAEKAELSRRDGDGGTDVLDGKTGYQSGFVAPSNLYASPSHKCKTEEAEEDVTTSNAPSIASGTVVAFTNDKMDEWFYSKRRFFGKKNLFRVAVVAAAVLWMVPLTLYFAGGSTVTDQDDDESCVEQNGWPFFATYTIIGAILVLIAYTSYRARNIYDGYYIKREIIIVLVGGVVGLALSALQAAVASAFFVYRVLWFVLMNVFLGMCLTWKVYISYSNERARAVALRARRRGRAAVSGGSKKHRKSGSVSRDMSLRSCLKNEMSMTLFVEHLKREFSVENILFYQAVQRYRTACTGDEITDAYLHGMARNRLAAEIYARYIDEKGELQVNLSAKQRRPVLETLRECIPDYSTADYQHTYYSEALADPSPRTDAGILAGPVPTPSHVSRMSISPGVVPADVFNDCQVEIFTLMEKDSFVRFKLAAAPESVPVEADHSEKRASNSMPAGKGGTNFSDVTQV